MNIILFLQQIHTKLKRSSELHKQHYKLLSNQASHDLQKVDIMKELSSEIDSLSNNIKQVCPFHSHYAIPSLF